MQIGSYPGELERVEPRLAWTLEPRGTPQSVVRILSEAHAMRGVQTSTVDGVTTTEHDDQDSLLTLLLPGATSLADMHWPFHGYPRLLVALSTEPHGQAGVPMIHPQVRRERREVRVGGRPHRCSYAAGRAAPPVLDLDWDWVIDVEELVAARGDRLHASLLGSGIDPPDALDVAGLAPYQAGRAEMLAQSRRWFGAG